MVRAHSCRPVSARANAPVSKPLAAPPARRALGRAGSPCVLRAHYSFRNNAFGKRSLAVDGRRGRLAAASERAHGARIASGALPAIKIGTGPRAAIRVDPGELEKWLDESHVSPAERRAPAAGQSTVRQLAGRSNHESYELLAERHREYAKAQGRHVQALAKGCRSGTRPSPRT